MERKYFITGWWKKCCSDCSSQVGGDPGSLGQWETAPQHLGLVVGRNRPFPGLWLKVELVGFRKLKLLGLPWWLSSKESACQAGDSGSIPGLGRSLGGGHDNPFQYSCLENPMDRGAWWAMVHRGAKDWSDLAHSTCGHLVSHPYLALILSSLSNSSGSWDPLIC